MIDFHRLELAQREEYERILFSGPTRGCAYSFANLRLWGRQEAAFLHGCVAFFSHYHGRSVYPYPIGDGDRRRVVEELLRDAQERGIPRRFTNLLPQDTAELEAWFPGRFVFTSDRDDFDYVYALEDLADLRGRKFQKKRNHVNRFWAEHPRCRVEPLTQDTLAPAREMVEDWFQHREGGDLLLERVAVDRAFRHYAPLGMEGLVLEEAGEVLAVTMGTRLSPDTFDIHFEKAREFADGAYAAVNQAFAQDLRQRHPELRYLDREEDMGLEGLRRAKLSYNPHHMVEKAWAYWREDRDGT